MYGVVMRGSQYFVINDRGATRAGPYAGQDQAQLAANWLNCRKRY
jgi:hypothetical protein